MTSLHIATSYKVPSVAQIKKELQEKGPLFNVVSFFAGGGGSSTGYRMARGNVLAINEFVPAARETYHANWPSTIIFPEDICSLNPEYMLEKIGIFKGELDILDGSPPCCAFSMAGKRDKGWGHEVKKYSDVKQGNIEDLFFQYVRMIDGFQPKVFVAENVSGLTRGTAKGYCNDIIRSLRSVGYVVEARLLNSQYLGVPQSRERIIFVGVRKDLWRDEFKGRLHPKPFNYIIPLRVALSGIKNTEEQLKFATLPPTKTLAILKKLKPGQANKSNSRFLLRKSHPEKPCFTVTASSASNTSSCGPCHWENRKFTLNEYKRIFSVPDDYILTGNPSKQGERLGRMVPPLMMKAIAENIYNVVLSKLR